MSGVTDPTSEVLAAARAVASELRRFEERASAAERHSLRSASDLDAATRELHAVVETDARIEAHLAALATAVARARQWKQDRALELAGTSLRVVERTARYEQLSGALRAVQQEVDGGANPRAILSRAHALLRDAQDEGLVDLADQARALIARISASAEVDHAPLF